VLNVATLAPTYPPTLPCLRHTHTHARTHTSTLGVYSSHIEQSCTHLADSASVTIDPLFWDCAPTYTDSYASQHNRCLWERSPSSISHPILATAREELVASSRQTLTSCLKSSCSTSTRRAAGVAACSDFVTTSTAKFILARLHNAHIYVC
jgi:hypothetical protein